MLPRNWYKKLTSCPLSPKEGTLFRCVPKSSYDKGTPPCYLFTSGRRNRCNPAGVLCVYMSMDRDTALTEYDKYVVKPEPYLVFESHFKASRILDLRDVKTCSTLGFCDADFFKPFRRKKSPTRLESLGYALSLQHRVAGIIFPSAACDQAGKKGPNIVLYKNAFIKKDRLSILDPHSKKPDCWP